MKRRSHGIAVLVGVLLALMATLPGSSTGASRSAVRKAIEAPSKIVVTEATGTSLTVGWSRPAGQGVMLGYVVYRDGARVGTTRQLRYTLSNLTCGRSYVIAVSAVALTGRTSTKATIIAPTLPCLDTQPPTTPSGLTVVAGSPATISVRWGSSRDNIGVVQYDLRRDGRKVASTTLTAHTFDGLVCGSMYSLAVEAVDASGNRSAPMSTLAATSACPDTTPPPVPSGLRVQSSTTTSLSVSWSANGGDTAGYTVYRNGVQTGNTSATSFTVGSLTCGASYTIALDAYDAAGNHSNTVSVVGSTSACPPPAQPSPPPTEPSPPPTQPSPPPDTTRPSTPGGLTAMVATATGISVSWLAASDNVGVTGYRLYLDGAVAATTVQLTYPFAGLVCGRAYTLAVEAYDAAGNTSARTSIQAATATCPPATPPPDTQPPSAPTGLIRSFVTETSFTVSWTGSTDNTGVAGYGVYFGGLKVAQTGSTSYAFTGLSCGTQYSVGVDAYDAVGNRSAVSSFVGSTAPCPDKTAPSAPTGLTTGSVGQTSIGLSWAASTDNVGVTGYDVIRNGSTIATVAGTSTTFTGLSCGTSHTLGVKAFDAAGNRSAQTSIAGSTSACTDTTPPSTPTGLATSNVGQTSLTVSWSASTDNVGVTGYRVYQGGSQVGTTSSTSYPLSGLTCGTSYTLGVAAVDQAGNVSGTATVNGATSACSSSGTANVYVATNGNDSTCARGAQSKPCVSFNKAFALAQAGDTVTVACGTYGAQTLSGSAKASAVSFFAETYVQPTSVAAVAAATSCVKVASLDISTSRVHVTGIQATNGDAFLDHSVEELGASGTLSDVVIDGWHGHQAGIYASGVTIQFSKLGDTNFCGTGYNFDEDALRFWSYGSSPYSPPDNDRLLNSVIRNWVGPPDGQCGKSNGHNDMFQTPGGNNMVFDGNLFYNGPTSNMQVGEFSGGVIGSLIVQNNYFGPTAAGNSLSIGQGHCGGIVIRHNVIAYPANAMPTNNNSCIGTMTQSANIYVGTIYNCGPSTFSGSYNIFPVSGGATCGTNAKRCAPSWANGLPPSDGSAWLPELNSSDTCAKDYVPATGGSFPATDIYGRNRPQGPGVDGGAFEASP